MESPEAKPRTVASSALAQAARMPRTRRLLLGYFLIALVPYALCPTLTHVAYSNPYTEMVTILSVSGLAMMLMQFALSGRVETVNAHTGIDNGMWIHRKMGELLALNFLLHPFLIVAPRVLIDGRFALGDLMTTFSQPATATGFYALALMIAWVLMAMFRDRLKMSYEAWRVSHGLGAVAFIILATLHVITVGRHGYLPPDRWLHGFWIALCTLAVGSVAYSYFIRPRRSRPFRIVACEKVGRSDWYLTLQKDGRFDFGFEPGQFVRLNTSRSPFHRTERPFSIASSPAALPHLSFVIRELGDYTARLRHLKIGQRAYVDGPHGAFTLRGRDAPGIGLIAAGAGIGPILGILRQLRDARDRRPIRLIYGNSTADQLIFQHEIAAMNRVLDFAQVLVLSRPPADFHGYAGHIDRRVLEAVFSSIDHEKWDYFICGPKAMVRGVEHNLRQMGIAAERVVFEQLAF